MTSEADWRWAFAPRAADQFDSLDAQYGLATDQITHLFIMVCLVAQYVYDLGVYR